MPKRQMHREVFFANNGLGPYDCFGCGEPLEFEDMFHVHHIDHNHANNLHSNLVAIHHGCHTMLHRTGSQQSDAAREKISIAGKGRVNSALHRAAIAKAGRERIWTPELRAKLSAAQKGRVITPEHRSKIAATLKIRASTPKERLRYSQMGIKGADARWHPEKEN